MIAKARASSQTVVNACDGESKFSRMPYDAPTYPPEVMSATASTGAQRLLVCRPVHAAAIATLASTVTKGSTLVRPTNGARWRDSVSCPFQA